LNNVGAFNPFLPTNKMDKKNIKTNVKDAIKRSNIPSDMFWVLK
jgi:hypothetical protein